MKRIKFAILGLGRIGRLHADTIITNPNSELVSINDPKNNEINNLKKKYLCQVMSIDDIASDDQIKGLLICTPTETHVDLIKKFLHTKKAVFCEKPLDLNLKKVENIVQLVRDTKSQVMVGFNRRFDPHFAKLKLHLIQKEIGIIEQIIITSRDPSPPTIEYITQSGGIFKDMAIHDFDMAVFLVGEKIHSISALGSNLVSKKIVEKELEIIKAEIINSGEPSEMVDKISKGKISKILNDNSLLDQIWIMDPKKKVSDILKENSIGTELKIVNFIKYRVGEGI